MGRNLVILAVAAAMLLLAVAPAQAGTYRTPPAAGIPAAAGAAGSVAGAILVQFKPGTPGATIAAAHRQNGGQVKGIIPRIDVQVVGVPAGEEAALIARYTRDANVVFAEINGRYEAFGTTSDPMVGEQWQYDNTGQTGGTPGADIKAFRAWDVATGSGSTPVAMAILDTGIDRSHEDLAAKIVNSVNFSESGTVDDLNGHGTHVAGSAAAATDNAVGVAGTCPGCVLYNVKVLDDGGSGWWDDIASGIVWAADNGAKVINMSFGGVPGSSAVESAVNYAWRKGAILVAGAGNGGTNSPFYPAYYKNVIAVAATDANDGKASFSNYGQWVSVAAPGVGILSTARGGGYASGGGTSTATPHAAGVAGLVWSTSLCGARNQCVRQRIEDNADAIAGTGSLWKHGRINAYSSVGGGKPAAGGKGQAGR